MFLEVLVKKKQDLGIRKKFRKGGIGTINNDLLLPAIC